MYQSFRIILLLYFNKFFYFGLIRKWILLKNIGSTKYVNRSWYLKNLNWFLFNNLFWYKMILSQLHFKYYEFVLLTIHIELRFFFYFLNKIYPLRHSHFFLIKYKFIMIFKFSFLNKILNVRIKLLCRKKKFKNIMKLYF